MGTTHSDQQQQQQQLQSLFLQLPTELIIETIAHLSCDRSSLCALARTSRFFQALCEKHLYSKIELLSTHDLAAIRHAFAKRPERAEAVQTLRILYKYNDDIAGTIEERQVFNEGVAKMKDLREWHIESPFDNFQWDEAGGNEWVQRDMETFRVALENASLRARQSPRRDVGLAKLEKLVLHSHGANTDFWGLDAYHCLFKHPSLRYLHVSCITFPKSDLPELAPFAATTPLTTLVFDECELEPASLRRILSTPKALKHLTLGENVANIRESQGPDPRLTSSPEAAIAALLPVAHSLETLTHFDPTWATLPDSGDPPHMQLKAPGMRDFFKLRFIQTDRCSFLHRGIISSSVLAPPNLETVRVHNYQRQYMESFLDELPDLLSYSRLQSIKCIELIQPMIAPRPKAVRAAAEQICDSLPERHACAYQLWKRGIRLTMYAEIHLKSSFIPPYLQGEPAPELLCVYDSDDVGFFQDSGDHVSSDETGPRETDQISNNDILRLNNKVSRAISHYLESKGIKGHGRNDPDLTDEATQAILMDLFGDDYDNNWIDGDFEDGEWPFAEEGLEDQMDDFLGAMLAQEDLDLSEESSDYDDEDDEDFLD